ncbi:MAG: hypothetical protein LBB76_02540 [Azoarcus sp.]|jgi:hypothetical protein|nr:hypothetical protein [Azoarcus sp.]
MLVRLDSRIAVSIVRLARQHYDFDIASYQPSRLELVDFIINEWKNGGANVNPVGKSMYTFASYAGEVLRNMESGRWFKPEETDNPEKLLDGRIWKPINLAFQFMIDKGTANFGNALGIFLESN